MKASSMEWELDIKLISEEIRGLANKSILGEIIVNTHEHKVGARNIELLIGNISSNQLYVELITEPPNVWVNKIVTYRIVLSHEGYVNLIKNGSTGDRMAHNSACNVMIYAEGSR